MVKSKDDYEQKKDDSRFKNFDKVLDPSYGQKQYYILILGLFIVFSMILLPAIINSTSPKETETKILYENGLNISYIPEDKIFSVIFTNPKQDTLAVTTLIQVPFDLQTSTSTYLTVYEHTSSELHHL
jgi:hypothetical protein